MEFNVSNYLTESSLGNLISQIFPDTEIIHNKKLKDFEPMNYRPDYYLPERKIIIEFDGYHHFTDNGVIQKDILKDLKAEELGITLIRIPYFIQLNDSRAINSIIGDVYGIDDYRLDSYFRDMVDYPHGFIARNAALPGKFTELGLARYNAYLNNLISKTDKGYRIVRDVWLSLILRLHRESKLTLLECFPEFYKKGFINVWFSATDE